MVLNISGKVFHDSGKLPPCGMHGERVVDLKPGCTERGVGPYVGYVGEGRGEPPAQI